MPDRRGDHADLTWSRWLVHAPKSHNESMQRLFAVVVVVVAGARIAAADDAAAPPAADVGPVRDPDASLGEMLHGPFRSSRLFAMPTADVVGAYVLSLSLDGSLLQQPGVLTSAGVIAAGFGDIAQLEYRHTEAISITGVDAPVPAVGVQLKLPIPEHAFVPALGIAFRLGVPRGEQFGAVEVDESVTDFYIVAREQLAPWLVVHGGVRISSAKLELAGDPMRAGGAFTTKRTLGLPTAGVEITMNPTAKIVAEAAAAPQFAWMVGTAIDPTISYGMLGRLGLRWSVVPSVILDGSLGYQIDIANAALGNDPRDIVQQWDIRLGAEVFVPWGALACRATGAFCDERPRRSK